MNHLKWHNTIKKQVKQTISPGFDSAKILHEIALIIITEFFS